MIERESDSGEITLRVSRDVVSGVINGIAGIARTEYMFNGPESKYFKIYEKLSNAVDNRRLLHSSNASVTLTWDDMNAIGCELLGFHCEEEYARSEKFIENFSEGGKFDGLPMSLPWSSSIPDFLSLLRIYKWHGGVDERSFGAIFKRLADKK